MHFASASAAFARQQRGRDCARQSQSRGMIDHSGTLRRRRLAGFRHRVHQTRARPCRCVVKRGAVFVGAAMAVAVERRVDQARIARRHCGVAEMHALERFDAQAGYEHVRALDYLHREGEALGAAQVDGDRALVAIVEFVGRHGTGAAHGAGSDCASNRIAAVGVFELDDLGAPVAEYRRGGRSGHPHREFYHLDSGERSLH